MADIQKSIRFVLLGDDKGASGALKKVGSGFRGALKDAQGFGGKAKLVGGAIAGIAAGAVIAGAAIAVKFGKQSIDTFKRVGGETRTLSRITGLGAEDASRLGFAFKMTGIDAATGAKSMGIFAKNVVAMSQKDAAAKVKAQAHADAIRGQIKALEAAGPKTAGYADKMDKLKGDLATATAASHLNASALGQLGIKYTDAHGKLLPMKDLLPQIADKFAAMPDGAEKSAAAMKLFGKGGLAMLPFLNKGAAGLKELGIQSDKTGNTLSGKQLDALKKNKEEQRKFDAAMQGLSVTLGSMLLPLMTQGAEFMNSVLVPALMGATQFVKDNQGAFDGLGNMLRWFWNAVLLPVMKFWIISNAETVKGLGLVIEATGRLTGNKDMEAFGKGIQNAATKTQEWANSLKEIPKPAPVKIMADTSVAIAKAKDIDNKITTLSKKRIELKSHGDTAGVKKIDDAIRHLQDKKNSIPISVGVHMNKAADQVVYKIGAKGTMKFTAAATGGWRRGLTRVGEYGPEYLSLSRPTFVSTAAQSARMDRGEVSGTSRGGSTMTVILKMDVPTTVDRKALGREIRDVLIELKGSLGGNRGLGLG